jgi:hypothetical protein
MSAPDFSAALLSLGIRCEIEEQGKLAVIIPADTVSLDARTRRTIVALGRTHGFANVCVELRPVDAALSGD